MSEKLSHEERVYAYYAPEIGASGAFAIALTTRDASGQARAASLDWQLATEGEKVAPLAYLSKHQAQMLVDDLARAGIIYGSPKEQIERARAEMASGGIVADQREEIRWLRWLVASLLGKGDA